MPDRKLARRRTLWRLVLFNVLGGVLALLGETPSPRSSGRPTEPIWPKPTEPDSADDPKPMFTDKERQRSRRRFATSLAFATLFFAGAAFSAGAGDVVVDLLESDEPAVPETSEGEPAAAEETEAPEELATNAGAASNPEPDDSETENEPSAAEPVPDAGSEAEPGTEAAEESVADSTDEEASEAPPADETGEAETSETSDGENEAAAALDETQSEDGVPTVEESESVGEAAAEANDEPGEGIAEPAASAGPEAAESTAEIDAPAAAEAVETSGEDSREAAPVEQVEEAEFVEDEAPPVVKAKPKNAAEPEIESTYATATVWLHRELPDPTPPARRLKWAFKKELRSVAAEVNVDWALVLAVVRANGHHGSTPATRAELEEIAISLVELGARKDEWAALVAYSGRTDFADRALALARYNRAVGLRSLVRGLDAVKEDLADKVLDDDRIRIYAAGRADIEAGRIDVRVLVLMLYLAEAHDQVTVSSLFAGHRLYARPGVISAHIYGLAVDIAALGGQPILGNSQPGGITEEAVRNILLLPTELQPQQVISLLGLGGPSFPLADHADHIHVGY